MLLSLTLVVAEASQDNLVLYLPLEDARNPLDLSDNPATVTVHGSLNAVAGQFGANGLEFNGNNANIIEVADMAKLEGMSALTIEAWARPRNLAGQEGLTIASKRNGTNIEDSYNLFNYGIHYRSLYGDHYCEQWRSVGTHAVQQYGRPNLQWRNR